MAGAPDDPGLATTLIANPILGDGTGAIRAATTTGRPGRVIRCGAD